MCYVNRSCSASPQQPATAILGDVEQSVGGSIEIACSLGAEEAATRATEFSGALLPLLRRWERSPGTVRGWFQPELGATEAALRELARLEKECCPFLDLTVAADGREIRLEITAPPEGEAILDLFTEILLREAPVDDPS